MVKSRGHIGDGHPTFNRNSYNGYINPYYWVDDHPLLYGNVMGVDRPDRTHDRQIPRSHETHSKGLVTFFGGGIFVGDHLVFQILPRSWFVLEGHFSLEVQETTIKISPSPGIVDEINPY